MVDSIKMKNSCATKDTTLSVKRQSGLGDFRIVYLLKDSYLEL